MTRSKVVLTATTVLGVFGMGWLIIPDSMGRYWGIALGENLTYMGHRYGAFLIGLAVTVWAAETERDLAPHSGARAEGSVSDAAAAPLTVNRGRGASDQTWRTARRLGYL